MLQRFDVRRRARAAGIHLTISAAVAMLAAALVFGVWFPGAFRLLAGGRDLFLLVVSVDVVLGPLLTLCVFNLAKGWPRLRRDLAIIATLQTAALAYGLHTVYLARPVALVFEVDRFRVVAANDVNIVELPAARPEYRRLPLTGPWLLSARRAEAGEERNDALFMALRGFDTGQRPPFWRPYEDGKPMVLARARPLSVLIARYPDWRPLIDDKLRELSLPADQARFVPVIARGDWVAVLDATGHVAGFVPLDGFF
jgi:hypothetical protein